MSEKINKFFLLFESQSLNSGIKPNESNDDSSVFKSLNEDNYGEEFISSSEGSQASDNQETDASQATQILTSKYDSDEWEDIKPVCLYEMPDFCYEYSLGNGISLLLYNNDNLNCKRNKNTGEYVIIGVNIPYINLSGNDTVTLAECTVSEISVDGENSTLNIKGSHSKVTKIIGSEADDKINISDGAAVEEIITKGGSDSIIINGNSSVKSINSGADDDYIYVNSSKIGKIQTDAGNKTIEIENNSVIEGDIKTQYGSHNFKAKNSVFKGNIDINNSKNLANKINVESGNNQIDINSCELNKKVMVGGENSVININNSFFSSVLYIKGTSSDVHINGSKINEISGNTSYCDINLNMKNCIIDKLNLNKFSLVNNGKKDIYAEGCVINYNDSFFDTKTIINHIKLDDTYKDFKPISGEDMGTYFLYNLPDGTQITSSILRELSDNGELKYTGGEIFYNEKTGDIILNGLSDAEIIRNSAGKIFAFNCGIKSAIGVKDDVIANSSIINKITVNDAEKEVSVILNNTIAEQIFSENSEIQILAQKNSQINKIEANKSGKVTVLADKGNVKDIIATGTVSVDIQNSAEKPAGVIGKISTEKGDITASQGEICGVTINDISTKEGNIAICANQCNFRKVKNKNRNGNTNLILTDSKSDTIDIESKSNIVLNSSKISGNLKIYTSSEDVRIQCQNSYVNKLDVTSSNSVITVGNSKINVIDNNYCTLAISNSDVGSLCTSGDIAIQNSIVPLFSGFPEYTKVYVNNSMLDEMAVTDSNGENNSAVPVLKDLILSQNKELYKFLSGFIPDSMPKIDLNEADNKKYEEAISEILAMNLPEIEEIKMLMIEYMESEIQKIDDHIKIDNETKGLVGKLLGNDTDNITKKEFFEQLLNSAKEGNDVKKIFEAYSVISGKGLTSNELNTLKDTVEFSKQLDDENIDNILEVFDYIANLMSFVSTEQDGFIRDIISLINKDIDIGTNINEVYGYIDYFKSTVNSLRDDLNKGVLTKEEFASKYYMLTGYPLTQKNMITILDNIRDNDKFDNIAETKIADYNDTQKKLYNTMKIACITLTSVALTAGLSSVLSISEQSKTAKSLIKLCSNIIVNNLDKNTNGIVADNISSETNLNTVLATLTKLLVVVPIASKLYDVLDDSFINDFQSVFGSLINKDIDMATDKMNKEILSLWLASISNQYITGEEQSVNYMKPIIEYIYGDINSALIDDLLEQDDIFDGIKLEPIETMTKDVYKLLNSSQKELLESYSEEEQNEIITILYVYKQISDKCKDEINNAASYKQDEQELNLIFERTDTSRQYTEDVEAVLNLYYENGVPKKN